MSIREYGTDRQKEIYDAVEKVGSVAKRTGIRKAAKLLGLHHQTVSDHLDRLERRAAKKGRDPKGGEVDRPTMPGFTTKRVSTAKPVTFADGTVGYQWHIQEPERVALEKMLQDFVAGFTAEVHGKARPTKAPGNNHASLMSCYNLGDHHLGMLANPARTGNDAYNLNIAYDLALSATDYLVDRAPRAKVGVLNNTGDFFHADDSRSVTPMSGHQLDTDGDWGTTLDVGGALIRAMVDRMLEKHDEVWVCNVRGNHDPNAALALNSIVKAYYCNEPRVKVLPNLSKFIWYQWGKNLVVLYHGDRMKRELVHQTVVANLRQEWAASNHIYGWQGHIHSKVQQEIGGMLFESFGVLPPPDAWHSDSGYGANIRSMSNITLDIDGGHDCRFEVPVHRLMKQ